MSDARNSSGNIRGGGAKQTGGAGRSAKGAAPNQSSKASVLGGSDYIDPRSEAKRNLQLQVMSKQLASIVKAACLTAHTEEEYQEFNIPMPDPGAAMKKLKAMKEFTQNWYDKDFREQWLLRVRAVWEEELRAEYRAAFEAANRRSNGGSTSGAGKESEHSSKDEATEETPMSIPELEAMIERVDISAEERKRLKTKLKNKKKKQKAKKKNGNGNVNPQDDACLVDSIVPVDC
jgi:hypothetical protein